MRVLAAHAPGVALEKASIDEVYMDVTPLVVSRLCMIFRGFFALRGWLDTGQLPGEGWMSAEDRGVRRGAQEPKRAAGLPRQQPATCIKSGAC